MSQTISYDLDKIGTGVDKIANVVKSTLGPFGKNVGYIENNRVINTKDGVTVAKKVTPLKDEVENYAANIVKKAADEAVKKAGDGTTTTCVLTQAIYKYAKEFLQENKNIPVSQFIRNLKEEATNILNQLLIQYVDISKLRDVLKISTNGDEELINVLMEAFENVGEDGIITIEESHTNKTELKKVDGLCFDTGIVSPYFVNKPEKMCAEYEATPNKQGAPYVLVYDGNINSADNIVHLLEAAVQAHRPIVIIAQDITGECLATLVVNRMRTNAPFVAIKAPGYGDAKKQWMADIAIVTGAQVIDPQVVDIKDCGINYCGTCQKITSTQYETTIAAFDDPNEELTKHIATLEQAMEHEVDEYYREKIQERIARLKNGVSIIKLFANNSIEEKEKEDRLDDAIKAGRAALKDGIVVGGGSALYKVSQSALPIANEDAFAVLQQAIQEPIKTILANAGYSKLKAEKLLKQVAENDNSTLAVIEGTSDFTVVPDGFDSGIIDPALVVKTALMESVAAASILINTAAVIYPEKEENK